MPAGDLYKVVVNQSFQSSVVQNVLYYEDTDGVSSDPEADIFLQWNTDVRPAWLNSVSDLLTMECLDIQKVFPLPIQAIRPFDVSLAGQLSGGVNPAMDAALYQKVNDNTGGIGKKGRLYVAGLREIDNEEGRVTSAYFILMTSLANALDNELIVAGGSIFKPSWAVRSNLTPFGINSFLQIDQVIPLPRVATQRRRRTPVKALT